MEIWKDIQGYEGLYQVSNYGMVKGLPKSTHKNNIIIKPLNMNKYYYVRLSKNNIAKNYSIHRLVAQSFISNFNNLPQVNHKDGDKHNNYVENLEWISPIENVRHAFKNNLINKNRKSKIINCSHKIIQKDLNNNIIKVWCDYDTIIKNNNSYKKDTISKVCTKRNKRAYGFVWEFYG